MILFTVALSDELKIIKKEVKALKLPFKVDFLLTWVWVENTIYSLKDYIQKKEKPEFIINIWVCGKINDDFLDFFQVYRIKNYLDKESICPIYIKNSPLKSIFCSNKIITDKNEMKENFVDMESFWIDFIADKEKIPYIIIKKPFDLVSKDSKKIDLKDLKNNLKWFDYKKLLWEINNFLWKKENNFDKKINDLKEKYRLTFSETELLRKYINKCIAFWKEINFINKDDLLMKIKQ